MVTCKPWHVSCRREKSLLSRSVHNLEDMRREMYHMHRALLKERSKCRALEDELQNPQNVHRWRKLEVRSLRIEVRFWCMQSSRVEVQDFITTLPTCRYFFITGGNLW